MEFLQFRGLFQAVAGMSPNPSPLATVGPFIDSNQTLVLMSCVLNNHPVLPPRKRRIMHAAWAYKSMCDLGIISDWEKNISTIFPAESVNSKLSSFCSLHHFL